jgi:hypothetical protein
VTAAEEADNVLEAVRPGSRAEPWTGAGHRISHRTCLARALDDRIAPVVGTDLAAVTGGRD